MSEDGRRGGRRIAALAAVVALAGVPLHAVATGLDVPAFEPAVPVWAVAVGFLVAELLRVSFRVRGHPMAFSFTEIPLLIGAAALHPGLLVAARLPASLFGQVVGGRRPRPAWVGLNVSVAYLETSIVVVTYRALIGGASPISPAGLSVAVIALLAGTLVAGIVIAAATLLVDRGVSMRFVIARWSVVPAFSVAAAGVAAGALVVVSWEPIALAAVIAVAVGVLWAMREHVTLRRRFEDLESMYAFISTVDRAESTGELVEATLRQCADLFDADLVEVVMARGVGSTASTIGAGGNVSRRPAPPAVLEVLDAEALRHRSGAVALEEAPSQVRRHYEARGFRGGMVATVAGGGGTATMIVVGVSDTRTASADHLRLLDALTRQARVAFERVRLLDRLRLEIRQKEHQILHDSLTGLPNRFEFSIAVEDALRRSRDGGEAVAVFVIDLDHFKEVNDTLGHQRGDVLLREMGRRLTAAMGDGEHLARLGGDEFGVVMRGGGGVSEVLREGRRFADAVHQPFATEGLSVRVTGSIGIAMAPDHGTDGETLLQRAEVAMYEAKRVPGGIEVYDPQRDRYSARRLALASDLRDAIENGVLEVHYQPKAALVGGRVVGVEALSRWNHPRHGEVPPGEFIEAAERTGLIGPLTEHVLRTALRDAVRLHAEVPQLSVSVNVAASSLDDPEFPEVVATAVGEAGIDPRTVVLELTESTLMTESPRARLVLAALDEIGVELSIDDFGTGYSSLSYLNHLPVDEVKIDRSFVSGMAADPRLASIVTSTVALGHSLGLRVVAEGVEQRTTWDLLLQAGCDLAQGFYVAVPMPYTDLAAWMDAGGIADGQRGPRAVSQ